MSSLAHTVSISLFETSVLYLKTHHRCALFVLGKKNPQENKENTSEILLLYYYYCYFFYTLNSFKDQAIFKVFLLRVSFWFLLLLKAGDGHGQPVPRREVAGPLEAELKCQQEDVNFVDGLLHKHEDLSSDPQPEPSKGVGQRELT